MQEKSTSKRGREINSFMKIIINDEDLWQLIVWEQQSTDFGPWKTIKPEGFHKRGESENWSRFWGWLTWKIAQKWNDWFN
jgi:hypothetical protein